MNGNTFGRIFRITTWGESHGPAVGAVIDGCPAGIPLSEADFVPDMTMRQGGQGAWTTSRKETDQVQIESGVFASLTTGTPISLRIENNNSYSQDYEAYRNIPRPGHADLTTYFKHRHRDHRGGGRLSARETVARVAAGVVAKKILARNKIELLAFVRRIGDLVVSDAEAPFHSVSTEAILTKWWPRVAEMRLQNPLRLPCENISAFLDYVESAKQQEDSLGGAVECWVKGLPPGLGEPIFDKLNASLSHALMTLPAAVAVEVGGGWLMSQGLGSEIRDPIIKNGQGNARVQSNRHGGLLGGMTTGEPLWMNVHFHAPTSIPQSIDSLDLKSGETAVVRVAGRHDSFPLPRAVPMVEAMAAIVLVDAIAIRSPL